MIKKEDNFYKLTLVTGLICVLSIVSVSLYIVSMPGILKSLELTEDLVQLTLAIYVIGQTFGPLLSTIIVNFFGYYNSLLLVCTCFNIASFFCLISTSAAFLCINRFIEGFSIFIALTIGYAAIKETFSIINSTKAFAITSLMASLAHIIAPTFGGIVEKTLGFKFNFLALFTISVILTILLISFKKTADKVLLISKKQMPTFLGFLKKIKYIKQVINSKVFIFYTSIMIGLNACTWIFFSMSPFYYIEYSKIDPDVYGYHMAFTTIGYAIGSWLMLHLPNKYILNTLLLLGTSLCCISGLIIVALEILSPFLVSGITICQFIYALGKAMISPIVQVKILNIDYEEKTLLSSLFFFITMLGSTIGSLLGIIIDSSSMIALGLIIIFVTSLTFIFFKYLQFPRSYD